MKTIVIIEWDKTEQLCLCPDDIKLALEEFYPYAKFSVGEFGKCHDVSDLYEENDKWEEDLELERKINNLTPKEKKRVVKVAQHYKHMELKNEKRSL